MAAAEAFNEPLMVADGLSAVACVRWTQARWAESVDPLLTAHRIYRSECSGCIFESVHLHWQVLWSFFFLGRLADLSREVDWIQRDAVERDDTLAWLTSVCGSSVASGLARDRVAEIRRGNRRLWAHQRGLGYQLLHVFRLIGATMSDCYTGRLTAAWKRLQSHQRGYRNSDFSRLQIVRIQWCWMHLHTATSLAATSSDTEARQAWSRIAEAWLARLRRERLPFAEALAEFSDGQLAELRGDAEGACQAYRRSRTLAAEQQLRLYQLAAEDRLERLAEGRPGKQLVEHLAAEGVVDPKAFARILAAPLEG